MDNMHIIVSPVTRKDTEVWLIGQPIDVIRGMKLPSKGDVLRRFFYLMRTDKKSVRGASSIVAKEVMGFWRIAKIPTMEERNIIPKIEKAYDGWRTLQKGSTRRSQPQTQKENMFTEELDNLFDIGHADALDMINIEEDKLFLLAQREKGRRGYMAGEDRKLAELETRKQLKKASYEAHKRKQEDACEKFSAMVELASSSSSSGGESSTDDEDPPTAATPCRKRKRGKQNIVTPDVASALDRTQVTDRKAVFVLTATASSLGHDVGQLAINRSTIRRARIETRTSIAALVKETFQPNTPLTVHWDGKMLPELMGNDKVDRLPVIISGAGLSKLLGVPRLPSGTGKAMAEAVIDCLEDWGVKDRVVAMSFDTTSSNTGIKSGACTLIEAALGRDVLHLACRHHIMELIAEKAFSACDCIPSTGPAILLFQRFKQQWNFINKLDFRVPEDDVSNRDELLIYFKQKLSVDQPRDDYKELLELSLIYLGDVPQRGIRFMQPGAVHRARWMARVIYAIKICLFQAQFVMTKREQLGINRFARFAVTVYVQFWFSAPDVVKAPANDLRLLQQLASYSDRAIAKATSEGFSRHLWYLSEYLVAFSFFDRDVSNEVKRAMVVALGKSGSDHPVKRITMDAAASTLGEKTVADFVTRSSRRLFEVLNIQSEFLLVEPDVWESRADYQAATDVVRAMKVVNDSAERGVALMQQFNQILTKNEEQKQFLLQVVEQHQRLFPNSLKKTVTDGQ